MKPMERFCVSSAGIDSIQGCKRMSERGGKMALRIGTAWTSLLPLKYLENGDESYWIKKDFCCGERKGTIFGCRRKFERSYRARDAARTQCQMQRRG